MLTLSRVVRLSTQDSFTNSITDANLSAPAEAEATEEMADVDIQ